MRKDAWSSRYSKPAHRDHVHGLTWLFIIALMFGFRCSNCCDLDQAGLEARVQHLEERERSSATDARTP